jgi:hypothetical protein
MPPLNNQTLSDETDNNLDPNQQQGDIQDPSDDGDNSSQSDDSGDNSSTESEEYRLLTQVAQNATRQNQILQQQLQQLQQQVDGVSRTVTQATPPKPIVTDEDFQTAPAAALERLLDAKLSATIAPLINEQRANQRERVIANALPQILGSINPEAAGYAEVIAPVVKNILGDADPTPQNLQMAVLMAVGQYALKPPTETPRSNNSSPANENMGRRSTPPSVPNSAPRSPAPQKTKLTETQTRLFNKLGYKPGQEAEFIKFLEADEVTFQ